MPIGGEYEIAMERGKFHRRYKGSFTPNGAGVSTGPGATSGIGFTASYAGLTGVYRVTLESPFKKLISGNVTFQAESAYTTPTTVQIGSVLEAGGLIDIVVWAESAGTLAKANVTASGVLRRINFEFAVAVEDLPGVG